MSDPCPLCTPPAERVFWQGKLVVGLWAEPPVTPGHALLVTRRHVTDWFAASPAEQQELLATLTVVRDRILERQLPDGFNIGIHIGTAAGQKVLHLQIDVIPRYREELAPAPAPGEDTPPGARPARPPTDAWTGQAPVSAEPLLERVERELDDQARRSHGQASVTRLPVPPRRIAAAAPAEPARSRISAAQPAEREGDTADPSAVEPAADEHAEPSSAYARVPGFRSLDGGGGGGDPYGDDSYIDDDKTRLPGSRTKWVVLVLLLLLGGGGYAAYWARTSPYVGEPPSHLLIGDAQRQPGSRPAAVTTRPAPPDPGLPPLPRKRTALYSAPTSAGTTTPVPASPGAGDPPAGTPASTPAAVAGASEYDSLVAQAEQLLKERKRPQAFKLLEQALALEPRKGWQALQHLAWRDLRSGRSGRALKRARLAVEVNDEAPYANLVIGAVMHERGNTGAARTGYLRFIKRCDGCPEVGEIQRVLRSLGGD